MIAIPSIPYIVMFEALGSDFTLDVVIKHTDPAKELSSHDRLDSHTASSVSNDKIPHAHNNDGAWRKNVPLATNHIQRKLHPSRQTQVPHNLRNTIAAHTRV